MVEHSAFKCDQKIQYALTGKNQSIILNNIEKLRLTLRDNFQRTAACR